MMVQDIEHGAHRYERIDEGQSDPDDKREILLSERLTRLLPMTATAQQRAHTKIDNANDHGNQGDGYQSGNRIRISVAEKIRGVGADDKKIDQPNGK